MIRKVFALAVTSALCVALCAASAGAQSVQDSANTAWVAGNTADALRLYQRISAADTTDARAMHRIALIHAWNGRYAESLRVFSQLLKQYPMEDDARLDRARVLAWSGDTRAAVATLDSITGRNPRNVDALQARAQFQSWAGDYDQALRGYERILEITPHDRSTEMERARVLALSEKFSTATAVYDSLLRRNPGDHDVLIGLGNILTLVGKNDSARAVFERIIAGSPNDIDALRGLARAETWRGNLRKGEILWREAVGRAPANIDVLAGYAQALRWEGRDAAAYEVLTKSLAISPTNTDTRTQLDLINAAFAPRIAPSVIYESDSDHNQVTTSAVSGAYRVAHRVEIRADAYQRHAATGMAEGDTERGLSANAFAGSLGFWAQLEPGWIAQVGIGAQQTDLANDGTRATAQMALTTPGWYKVGSTLSLARSALDGSAALVGRRVYADEASIEARTTLARFNLSAAAGTARYHGSVSGQTNSRWNTIGTASTTFSRAVTIGIRARAFGFSDDLNDAYFDPDFYGIVELTTRLIRENKRWSFNAEAAPGVQKVRSTGNASASYRVGARLGYVMKPGRTLGINATYAKSGLQQLSPTAGADYKYAAIGIAAGWTF